MVQLEPGLSDAPTVLPVREIPPSEEIPAFLVSHPLGTSTKVDVEARLRPSPTAGVLWLRGDAFQGSSGGGVFDGAGRLIGILTGGLPDFRRDREADCMRLARSESDGYERVSVVGPILERICAAEPDHPFCAELAPAHESTAVDPPFNERGCTP